MKHFKVYALLNMALVLSGCATADMISAPLQDKSSPFAPVNEQSRVGTIKYLNQGADFIIEHRRKDAYKQMYAACRGKYEIVSEGPRAGMTTVTSVSGGNLWTSGSEYWHINFRCLKKTSQSDEEVAEAFKDDF